MKFSLSSINTRPFGEIDDDDTVFIAFLKTNQEVFILLGTLIFLGLVAWVAFGIERPREGTWRYAICKVFLERYAQYPTDVKILTADEKRSSVQIGYLATNSYGMRESKLMECFYNIQQNRVELSRITINRRTLTLNNPTEAEFIEGNEDERPPVNYDEMWVAQNNAMQNLKYPSITFESFNRIVPLIISNEDLDKTMPRLLPNSLEDLKYN
jgi:hypothetical protein